MRFQDTSFVIQLRYKYMKKLSLIFFTLLSFTSIAQQSTTTKFTLSIKGAHYLGRYTDDAIGNEFFENYFFQGKINYSLNARFVIGGFYANARGRERVFRGFIRSVETGEVIGTRSGNYFSYIHIVGTSFQYCLPTIYTKNVLGVDEINFYAALEGGFLLYNQLYADSTPAQDDAWVYNIGGGANFQMGPRFFLNTEVIWDQKILGRFGFGWRLGKF